MLVVRQLTDSIQINSPPGPIWEWLARLPEHYAEWHPDHVSAEWERGKLNQVGSILRAVENLGDQREVLRFEMTSVDPPDRFEYRIRGPISLLLPFGSFAMVPDDEGVRFTASISIRFGTLTEHLFKRRTAGLRQHMKEEGENLKRIIEAAK